MANAKIEIVCKRTLLSRLINKRLKKLSLFIINNFAIAKFKVIGESKWTYINLWK
jgi:hypothetical protein